MGELWATLGRASREATGAAIYLGLLPGAVAYLAWAYVLWRLPAARAASALYLVPPLASIIAWLILGETPRATALLGGGIVLAGVALVNARRTGAAIRSGPPPARYASALAEPRPRSRR